MTTNNSKFGSSEITQLLGDMNEKGNFPIAVVADNQGFLIASAAAPGQNPEVQSAVVALVQKAVFQAGDQLGLAQTDEFSLYDAEGRRLVCRPFSVNEQELVLAVLVPNRHQTYRRLTNIAVNTIRRQWKL